MKANPTTPEAGELSELALRCEGASGPDQKDVLIDAFESLARAGLIDPASEERFMSLIYVAAYPASAAILVPDNAFWSLGNRREGEHDGKFHARIGHERHRWSIVPFTKSAAATPALALCAASLRARAAPGGQ